MSGVSGVSGMGSLSSFERVRPPIHPSRLNPTTMSERYFPSKSTRTLEKTREYINLVTPKKEEDQHPTLWAGKNTVLRPLTSSEWALERMLDKDVNVDHDTVRGYSPPSPQHHHAKGTGTILQPLTAREVWKIRKEEKEELELERVDSGECGGTQDLVAGKATTTTSSWACQDACENADNDEDDDDVGDLSIPALTLDPFTLDLLASTPSPPTDPHPHPQPQQQPQQQPPPTVTAKRLPPQTPPSEERPPESMCETSSRKHNEIEPPSSNQENEYEPAEQKEENAEVYLSD
ncbi:hypothetical protein DFH27DRAFT_529596 [Peziza echinospora]|nr:hypothetical protein DFH27DRAFT_529596 [Peziza echinospora]